jgi:hypothetical protein
MRRTLKLIAGNKVEKERERVVVKSSGIAEGDLNCD